MYTTSTKYCGLSVLDVSNGLTVLSHQISHPYHVELSLTHFAPTDLDFSLTDFPPGVSSEVVLTFLPSAPSPVFVFSAHLTIHTISFLGLRKKNQEKQKVFFSCEDQRASPTITVFVNFQISSTIMHRLSPINSWLITRWTYEQLVDKSKSGSLKNL